MKTNAKTVGVLAVLAVLAGAALGSPAAASDWSLSFGFGNAHPASYRPEYRDRRWVAERYETRYEQVLACAEHYERRYVDPVYETCLDRYGRPYTCAVRPGYWTEVLVPARYETRAVTVLVPGYWQEFAGHCDGNGYGYYSDERQHNGNGNNYRPDTRGDNYRPDTRGDNYRPDTRGEDYRSQPRPEIPSRPKLGLPEKRNTDRLVPVPQQPAAPKPELRRPDTLKPVYSGSVKAVKSK